MILPAVVTILLIIAYPLVYTLWMAVHEYSMGAAGPPPFIGLANYRQLLANQRFLEAIPRTFLFTAIGVLGPTVLGTAAALVFARPFPGRGLLRTVFSLPMMATPVSIALIWQMMFHPQLGILNYLLSLVGIGPQPWIFSRTSALPSLAMVETWQWTPFVMLIVLGGLAALPTEPYEAAADRRGQPLAGHPVRDDPAGLALHHGGDHPAGHRRAEDLRHHLRDDAGGPGTATETLNIFLYLQALPPSSTSASPRRWWSCTS